MRMVVTSSNQEQAMSVTTIGLDLAKSVFQVHGVDAGGHDVLKRRIRRRDLLAFFEELPPCLVGMEACSSAHHWARELVALGHDVRLIPPQYVKPYVKTEQDRCGRCRSDLRSRRPPEHAVRSDQDEGEPGAVDTAPCALAAGAAADGRGELGARASQRVRDCRCEGHLSDRRPAAGHGSDERAFCRGRPGRLSMRCSITSMR